MVCQPNPSQDAGSSPGYFLDPDLNLNLNLNLYFPLLLGRVPRSQNGESLQQTGTAPDPTMCGLLISEQEGLLLQNQWLIVFIC